MKVTFSSDMPSIPDFVIQGEDEVVMNDYNNCIALMVKRALERGNRLERGEVKNVDGLLVTTFNNGVTATIDPEHVHVTH